MLSLPLFVLRTRLFQIVDELGRRFAGEIVHSNACKKLSTMRCDAMRCDAMRCDAMRCDAMRCDAMRCDAMRCEMITWNPTLGIGLGEIGERALILARAMPDEVASQVRNGANESLAERHVLVLHAVVDDRARFAYSCPRALINKIAIGQACRKLHRVIANFTLFRETLKHPAIDFQRVPLAHMSTFHTCACTSSV
jgi:pentapeptide MXKDX repeat protein